MRLSTEFFSFLNLIYWAFHLQNYNLIFFRISIFLLNSSFMPCIVFLFSFDSLSSLGIHSGFYCVLFNFTGHSYNLFKKFFEMSSTSLALVYFGVELCSFGRVMLPCFFIFLVFCLGNYASEAKTLVEPFNHLCSFRWSTLNVQVGQCSGIAKVLFLTTLQ